MIVENINLTGHFLIAMPAMVDPFFSKTMTFICTHNHDGAMGIIINRPIELTFSTLFEQIKLELNNTIIANNHVHFGGPVQLERGFVLHQTNDDLDAIWDSTVRINPLLALTTSKDILAAVASQTGPKKLLVTLGYAGWTSGQLEDEMASNAWLSIKVDDDLTSKIIFDIDNEDKVNVAMSTLGLDFANFSEEVGHA